MLFNLATCGVCVWGVAIPKAELEVVFGLRSQPYQSSNACTRPINVIG